MRKIVLTAIVTAAVCFGIAAAAGLAYTGAHRARSFTLNVGDRAVFAPINFQCQVLSTTQAACGPLSKLANSVNVYYSSKQLAVVRYGKTPTAKGTLLFQINR